MPSQKFKSQAHQKGSLILSERGAHCSICKKVTRWLVGDKVMVCTVCRKTMGVEKKNA